jgi:AAA15 family ATPase/GTPase
MTAHFLTEIEIKEFKCFHDFKADGFKRVNLIGGKNNIGKTALMEAVYINVHSININTMITAIYRIKFVREHLNHFGDIVYVDNKNFLDAILNYSVKTNLSYKEFHIIEDALSKDYKFNINGELRKINSNDLKLIIESVANIEFMDKLYSWTNGNLYYCFYTIAGKNKVKELNIFAKEFDDAIDGVRVFGDKTQCKTNGIYRDITEFGDGLKHYISIICALYACENGYLFIDEIDNGIYYEHFDRLWEIVLTLSKETNCQVFATTHSKEMLESFARVSKKLDEQDISYTLLVKNKKQEIKSITDDYEMILDSISDERELRG